MTRKQVDFIKKTARKGRGYYDTGNTGELARRFGVSTATIRQIARGMTWL